MEIPEKIQKEADALGWRGVEYVGENHGSAFFVKVPDIDPSGKVLPTGLPKVLVYDGSEVMLFFGEEALILLGLFNHS